jgi:CheY-like chemotaxis protein
LKGFNSPVLAFVDGKLPEQETECKEAGFVGFLIKPISLEAIERLLLRLGLEKRPAGKANESEELQ